MDFVIANADRIYAMTLRHLEICGIAIGLAMAIGVPLGIICAKLRPIAAVVLGAVGVIYTIPTLALFGLMLPIFGVGLVPAIAAIVLYSLLPVVQNTYTGITGLRPEVREAAVGMGMGPGRLLIQIELPLAVLVIFAGIRIAVVNAIGMATLASLIGAGGLGAMVFRGISMVSLTVVLAGSIPVIALALVADSLLRLLEKKLSVVLGQASEATA